MTDGQRMEDAMDALDFAAQINATQRSVALVTDDDGVQIASVTLTRRYGAPVAAVWAALTSPTEIPRWFLPITGDLREGGTFALQGNAGGDILTCQAPHLLRVTFGGPTSIVEIRLSSVDDDSATLFEFSHGVPLEMAGGTVGALYVGPGWDGAMMGFGLFLNGIVDEDPAAMAGSIEVQRYLQLAINAWVTTLTESGTATAEQIAETAAVSSATFAPDVQPAAE